MKIDTSLLNDNTTVKKKKQPKVNRKQVIFWTVAGAVIFLAVILLGWFTYRDYYPEGYNNPETLATDFVEATYADDMETIIGMMPYEFKEKLYDNIVMADNSIQGNTDAMNEKLHKTLGEHLEAIDTWFVEDNWQYQYEIGEFYQYTDDEIQAVRKTLDQCGVDRKYKINAYGIIPVSVHVSPIWGDKENMNYTIYVPVLKHGNSWYLAQYIGDYASKVTDDITDIYGDLLDGFIIDTTLDQYGYKILYTNDGQSVTWNPEYKSYTFTDMYGNICLCTEDFKVTKIVGPDGGKRLTEDTYEEWWDNYYKEQYGEDDHDHDD